MRTEFLFIRRMPIHYVAPPVCDTDFTGTGEPSTVLSTHPRFKVTGLFVQEVSGGFRLNWNPVADGLCYNVYQLIGDEYVLFAECIPDTFINIPPGVYTVTVITREGESELSLPINTNESIGPAVTMTVVADQPETYEVDDTPGLFRFIRNGPIVNNFFCRFQLTGSATYGALNDYTLLGTTTLNMLGPNLWEIFIPDSVTEVFLFVTANADADIESDETVVVTLVPTSNYAVGSPDTATVTIKEGCKPESGVDTPCNLCIPDDTTFPTITIPSGPSGLVENSWGTDFPLGDYDVTYEGGAYKFDGNPNPGDFRIQQYKVSFGGAPAQYFDQFGNCLFPSVAQVEACVPIGMQLFDTAEGNIALQFDGNGTALDYPGGGVDPTFTLHRSCLYPTMPARVRIKNFNESLFDQCPDFIPSAQPAWTGQFPLKAVSPPSVWKWLQAFPNNFSFNGQEFAFASVEFSTTVVGNTTGCGWKLFLYVDTSTAPFVVESWLGVKRVGDTPLGIYYRDSGCSSGPDCLVIEAY